MYPKINLSKVSLGKCNFQAAVGPTNSWSGFRTTDLAYNPTSRLCEFSHPEATPQRPEALWRPGRLTEIQNYAWCSCIGWCSDLLPTFTYWFLLSSYITVVQRSTGLNLIINYSLFASPLHWKKRTRNYSMLNEKISCEGKRHLLIKVPKTKKTTPWGFFAEIGQSHTRWSSSTHPFGVTPSFLVFISFQSVWLWDTDCLLRASARFWTLDIQTRKRSSPLEWLSRIPLASIYSLFYRVVLFLATSHPIEESARINVAIDFNSPS